MAETDGAQYGGGAKGRYVGGIASLPNGDSLRIRPALNAEWTIREIEFGGAVELHRKDTGALDLTFYESPGKGSDEFNMKGVHHDQWIEVKNISGGTIIVSWDGMKIR